MIVLCFRPGAHRDIKPLDGKLPPPPRRARHPTGPPPRAWATRSAQEPVSSRGAFLTSDYRQINQFASLSPGFPWPPLQGPGRGGRDFISIQQAASVTWRNAFIYQESGVYNGSYSAGHQKARRHFSRPTLAWPSGSWPTPQASGRSAYKAKCTSPPCTDLLTPDERLVRTLHRTLSKTDRKREGPTHGTEPLASLWPPEAGLGVSRLDWTAHCPRPHDGAGHAAGGDHFPAWWASGWVRRLLWPVGCWRV